MNEFLAQFWLALLLMIYIWKFSVIPVFIGFEISLYTHKPRYVFYGLLIAYIACLTYTLFTFYAPLDVVFPAPDLVV
ncbi:MAG: hypothetical protein A2934_05890 [Candidatus Sungbacteria bacterium RIFCSPLOWO2_01_FULL_47_10]|uniref:Uncharacterized protein n=1 Tax=Candidatus Sungbacteria bacterium RIFCSPLOWO2_01_FULL_47_10 TaxID=1802276 RepID=A0A1G2LA70_9BACT|nr:MAG: hypothetical protein A2934_05890 [Candidatus Sungbacteria bacterium RIFCSPLOWO2_01_FULL_47_10]